MGTIKINNLNGGDIKVTMPTGPVWGTGKWTYKHDGNTAGSVFNNRAYEIVLEKVVQGDETIYRGEDPWGYTLELHQTSLTWSNTDTWSNINTTTNVVELAEAGVYDGYGWEPGLRIKYIGSFSFVLNPRLEWSET